MSGMSIQHNLSAMNADRYLGVTTGQRAKSSEKLSSGYQINRAADDAAGLSISEKMRRQIRGLTQAAKNCQDGVSLCQVADGALTETQDILQRMNELAIKAANGTLTSTDRQYCQDEVKQLKTEIDRIANTTNFNEAIYPLCQDSEIEEQTTTVTTETSSIKFDLPTKSFSGKIRTFDNRSFYVDGDPTLHHSGDTLTLDDTFVWEVRNSGAMTKTVFYYADDNSDGVYDSMSFFDFNYQSRKSSVLTQYSVSKDGNGAEDEAAHPTWYDHSPVLSDGATIKFVTMDDLKIDENGYAYLTPATVGGPADRYYFYPDIGTYDCPALIDPNKAVTWRNVSNLSDLAAHQCLKAEELPVTEETTVTTETITTKGGGLYIFAGSENESQNLIPIDLVDARTKALGVANVDISTVSGAQSAIDSVKAALHTVSEYRSTFGAKQNRLEHTINNLKNIVENTTAAESLIRDTDMAKEMSSYSTQNILQQAGQSVLAQANQSKQGILTMLQ